MQMTDMAVLGRGFTSALLGIPAKQKHRSFLQQKLAFENKLIFRPLPFPWRMRKRNHSSCRCTSEEKVQGEGVTIQTIPTRYKTLLMTSLAFVICNWDKVNMSVAIIPMSQQYGWPATTAGIVQSSFFLGYAFSQLPGGWLARQFGGNVVLRAGVLLWSFATALVPFSANWLPGILGSRVMVGLGEGVSPSAATDIVVRTFSSSERSRAVSFVFGGLSVGSIAGLLLAPLFIEAYGWESVFYVFGLVGIAWCITFNFEDKDSNEYLSLTTSRKVPWRSFFRSEAVWAMIYGHFCGNWGYFNLLAWLPTYANDQLHFSLTNAALVSIFPPLASVPVTSLAALGADKLISSGVSTTFVRKLCQSIAFLSPAACMSIVSLNPEFPPWVSVLVLGSGIALSSFSLSGLYCTHQDISPKYVSVLLGITNTAGALPGLLGVALTGYIYDQTHCWNLALFAPSIFLYLSGTLVWNIFVSCEAQSFD